MIIYKCKCGESLKIIDNSENQRKEKKKWKKKHDRKNIGNKWTRFIAKSKNQI